MPTAVSILAVVAVLLQTAPGQPPAQGDPPEASRRPRGLQAEGSRPQADPNSRVTVFFSGNTLGELRPCGCSGGQLGGLEKRPAILNAVDPNRRFIIDTGSLVPGASEQDLIKFNILIQALTILRYDLVNLTDQDLQIAGQLGLLASLDASRSGLDTLGSSFAVLTPGSKRFTKQFSTTAATLQLTVAVADSPDTIAAIFPPASSDLMKPCFNILILNQRDQAAVEAVSQTGIIDCILLPPQADESVLLSGPNDRPLVISTGRLGKYITRLDIQVTSDSRPLLNFTSIPVTEDIPSDKELVDLYRTYQQLVKDADLLTKHPRFPLPGTLEYVGSKACLFCHDYEYRKWKPSRHADAYATLVKVGSQYDPECILCHVIGLDFQTGFVTESKTPEMKDVGCENCHGPGSDHIRSLGAVQTAGPVSVCTDCHTPEHSGEYAANEKQYFEKIIHWREPVSRRSVSAPSDANLPPSGKLQNNPRRREPARPATVKQDRN